MATWPARMQMAKPLLVNCSYNYVPVTTWSERGLTECPRQVWEAADCSHEASLHMHGTDVIANERCDWVYTSRWLKWFPLTMKTDFNSVVLSVQGKRKKRKRDNKPDSKPEGKGPFLLSLFAFYFSQTGIRDNTGYLRGLKSLKNV